MYGITPMYEDVQFYSQARDNPVKEVGLPSTIIVKSDDGPIRTEVGNWEKISTGSPGLNASPNDGFRRIQAAVPIEVYALRRVRKGYSDMFSTYFDPGEFFGSDDNPFYPGTFIRFRPGYSRNSNSERVLYFESRVPNGQPKKDKPRQKLVEGIDKLVDSMLK